jgi:hypothetical protein
MKSNPDLSGKKELIRTIIRLQESQRSDKYWEG